jgi:peptide/nickel transport system permease protein
VQFGYWLKELSHGNLGQSIFLQRPVTQALWERAEPTTAGAAVGHDRGADRRALRHRLGGIWRGKFIDQLFTGFAMLGASVPSFWFGLVLMQIFAVSMGWFPVSGYGDPGATLMERVHYLVLPSVVLGVLNSALIIRFTRASMLDVLGEDYVRTARAKGLSENVVVLKHALRNALVPIVTVLGLTVALMIGGAVVTETVFGLPGVGNLVVSAVLRRDYPVIQGALLVIAMIYVVINFLTDLLYMLVDPSGQVLSMKIPLTLRRLFGRKIVLAAALVLLVVVVTALVFRGCQAPIPTRPRSRSGCPRPRPNTCWAPTNWAATCSRASAFGARYSLTIAALTAMGSIVLGTLFGLVAGFFRRLDAPIMRVVDAMMSFPDILLAIALVAILGPSMLNVVFALVLVYTPRVARVVRASTLVVRELLFVEAARAVACRTWRILLRHILPNLMSPILVQASFIFAYAILAEAALSFLGVGVPPEIPTWGTMVAGSQQYAHEALWIVLFPGLAIILTALSLQLLGDGVRDLLDPRLKKSM